MTEPNQFGIDPRKPVILIVTDSPYLHSGLARVTREIFRPIHAKGKFNIVHLGWSHNTTSGEDVPWPVVSTKEIAPGRGYRPDDQYGQLTFNELIPRINPQIVFAFSDPWAMQHIGTSIHRARYTFIAYTCIDSEPIAAKNHTTFKTANVVVTFGKWPQRVLLESAGVQSEVIPHGVDLEMFKPNRAQGEVLRQAMGDPDGTKIILGTVARNQPRKNLGAMFELMHYLKYGRYARCSSCDRITLDEINPCNRSIRKSAEECRWCHSKAMKHAEPDDRWVWYYHGAIQDVGWDMPDLRNRYALQDCVRWNATIKPVLGTRDAGLAGVYNAMDIHTCPTTAEGFYLPALESMACGVPQVLPNYSAHTDFAPAGGLMVEAGATYIDFGVGSTRVIISMEDWINKLLKLGDPVLRSELGMRAAEKAKEYDWKEIVPMWEKLFDSVLSQPMDSWRRATSI